ncbi:DNA-binding protein [Streptomyces sp. NRRL F-4489]|uniref:helix-turn-helix domain-containing protein n=1 Tax=Streptomyces sp. NRRL F-4489 TaxID=1609095 RepID=UPI000746FBCE|nr:helix-turn-helix transcriptional regulator [Streptomyces sp. NRRL F-4489]KUL41763.1 DNA-binding protein [Streptomyces sp. NRRL F-4489]
MKRRNGTEGSAATTAAVFGAVLRHYRELAGFTQAYLAIKIPCDRSQIARIEAGTRVPRRSFVQKCDALLGTGGMLEKLWEEIDWHAEVEHPDWFERRAGMDATALAIREYQEQVIPGLLQTQEYARAQFSRSHADPEEVESRVRARLSRQPRFLAEGGPLYIAVLDESCLRNAVGSPEVMRYQCAHLLDVGQRPNIRIQVAPAGLFGIYRPRNSLSLIELADERWVYSESLDRGHFSDDPAVYARHLRAYDVLRADIPSAHESAALISDAMEGYEQHGQARTRRGELDQKQLQPRQRRQLRGNRPRYPRLRPRS